ncbi:MAG: hypothetical protein H8E64_01360 [Candidatus Marinimicrobia bacterium]|nr:hypothetical protein [Candidatus Neomarinimicrobiota bacterium]
MKWILVSVLSVICLSSVSAQPGFGENPRAERMEMMAVWKLTEHLKLTEEQGQTFFPIFREHREVMKQIGKDQREIAIQLREKAERGDVISNEELKDEMKKLKAIEMKRIEVREQLFNRLEGTLNNVQRVKLLGFEHQFKKEIRKEIRKHQKRKMKHDPGQGNKKGFWN